MCSSSKVLHILCVLLVVLLKYFYLYLKMTNTDKSVEVLESIAVRMNDKFEDTIDIIAWSSDHKEKFLYS